MELGIGMYIFFIATTVISIALCFISSIDDWSGKFFRYFEDENRK